MGIRVTYDARANAAAICLTEIGPGGIARNVEAIPETVLLDFDEEGRMVGIEVLDARGILPKELLDEAEAPSREDR